MLEEVKEEVITETTKLRNDNRLIESKHNKLAHEKHFKAAVAAEVAGLISEFLPQQKSQNDMKGIDSELMLSFDGDNEYKDTVMDVDETYICNTELKNSVKEEHEIYQDLLIEHKDLLAL